MATSKTRPGVVIAAFCVSLAVGLFAVLGLLGGMRSGPQSSKIGGPFELTDQSGQTVTDKSLQGRPSLIFFGFTHCPDVCPTSLFEMSEVLRALGPDAGKVNAYFISVDPERDTGDVMKTYLQSFDPHLKGLTGSRAEIDKVAAEYRVYAKKVPLKDGDYTMDHTAVVYLMDRDGNFIAPFNLKQSPQAAAAELKGYL